MQPSALKSISHGVIIFLVTSLPLAIGLLPSAYADLSFSAAVMMLVHYLQTKYLS